MPLSQPELWRKIRNYPLPWREEFDNDVSPPRKVTTFRDNLRLEDNWTETSAAQIEAEYRKFLYLKAIDGGILTPSSAVDRAWHLHLALGDDFDTRLGDKVLGRRIPHRPGLTRRHSLTLYARTLRLYRREFDSPALADVRPPVWIIVARYVSLAMFFSLLCLVGVLASRDVPIGWWFVPFLPVYLIVIGCVIYFGNAGRPSRIARCG